MNRRNILGLGLAGLCTLPAQAKSLMWSAEIAADDPALVKITVDLRSESLLSRFTKVTCNVRFMDFKGHVLGDRVFAFTDAENPSLLGSKVYVRTFPHQIANASKLKAKGVTFNYTRRTEVMKK